MNASFTIDELRPWIEVRFDTASGPGGQNVNKVATRCTLVFDLAGCERLSNAQRARLREKLSARISNEGRLRVVRQAGRTQGANRAAAETELVRLLEAALRREKPRRATRPTRASRERRLDAKRRRGERKRERRGGRPE